MQWLLNVAEKVEPSGASWWLGRRVWHSCFYNEVMLVLMAWMMSALAEQKLLVEVPSRLNGRSM